ncbi:hypothetical protein COU17_01535 [Candidatus Kaiserbacteria bacterium CG10_big_fil_rev_8_21_14_0_10_49_17]|uniref:SHSP domain-containing protein n=1 Tax=Candidatus Kaiserbacteria bacterium CG10_big_fil_rev_8_21_14_0_10_49_17 TaxID=1974609 RepID=A0A2M6WET6_9BACT|nr:MAG: hypothetical protein COU17_01535 [Candidatus Kaiserbacteria bacterium CG10_big_fil_rev_8_21_14_0_10_49_17]
MAREKRSFFERLTGSVALEDYNDDVFEEEETLPVSHGRYSTEEEGVTDEHMLGEPEEGQLSVDVYQTPENIFVKAIVAGVRPDHLDVSITRDMVTIRGRREEAKETTEENYFYRELYWGAFTRTILLPQEIDVDNAEATEKHGVLTLKLPKLDKDRETKLKVKGS